jgi:hypothetical protein
MSAPASSLWLTLPAAPRSVLAGWLAWTLAAGLLAPALLDRVGAAGVAVAIAAGAAWLARRLPTPLACFRWHHVDDLEVTRLGPGRAVRRLPWTAVARCAQAHDTLTVVGDGTRMTLPLRPLVEAASWGPVLARVVPERAEALWRALDGGAVMLAPAPAPATARVAAWWWLPVLAAALAAGDAVIALVGMGLAVAERALVFARRRLRTVVLQPGGVVVPGNHGRFFAPWDGIATAPVAEGLEVRSARGTGIVPAEVDDFWAAAAVIELHAQTGFLQPDLVRFRVHVDGAEIAVVGEIEAA